MPVHMRHIVLSQFSRVPLLAACLRARPELGQHVLSLHIRVYSEPDPHEFWIALQQILQHTPRMSSFYLGWDADGSFATTLSTLDPNQLTYVGVDICHDAGVILRGISELKSLRGLSVNWMGSSEFDQASYPPALQLAHVRSVDWHLGSSSDNNVGIMAWLGACRFRADCALFVESATGLDGVGWSMLDPFFDAHACRLVSISSQYEQGAVDASSHILRRSHKVDFGGSFVPPPAIFRAAQLPSEIWFTVHKTDPITVMTAQSIIIELNKTSSMHNLKLHIKLPSWGRPNTWMISMMAIAGGLANNLALHGVTVLFEESDKFLFGFDIRAWAHVDVD